MQTLIQQQLGLRRSDPADSTGQAELAEGIGPRPQLGCNGLQRGEIGEAPIFLTAARQGLARQLGQPGGGFRQGQRGHQATSWSTQS